jgi:hypothetical protein
MKRKTILALVTALSLTAAMAIPAFAALGDDPLTPQEGDLGVQLENSAVIGSANAVLFDPISKNAVVPGPTIENIGDPYDIAVEARIIGEADTVYYVDISWGAMKFTFDFGDGTWNPATHTYIGSTSFTGWAEDNTDIMSAGMDSTPEAYLDGENNKIVVTNHSNDGIILEFEYAHDASVTFNDDPALTADYVEGGFYASNADAVTASEVLTGVLTDPDYSGPTLADDGTGNPILIPSAVGYDNTDYASADLDFAVYFAYSGTPDADRVGAISTYTQTGTITVTITPEN